MPSFFSSTRQRFLAFASVLVATGTMVCAAPVNYSCETVKKSAGGGVPLRLDLTVDAENTRAMVRDDIKSQRSNRPFPAELKPLSEGKFLIKWKLSGTELVGLLQHQSSASITYLLRLNTDLNTFTISGIVSAGSSLRTHGSGICKT